MTANTTNGLPYPTGGDALGDLDTIVQSLAQEIDDQVLAAWEAFTPTWTCSGAGTPNPGATGYLRGYRRHRGRSVDFRVKLLLGGSGLAIGAGNYNIGLDPVMVSTGNGNMDDVCVGAAVMWDSSAGATARFAGSVFVQAAATPTVRIALGGSGGGLWTAAAPFVPAAGDIITLQGTYEAPFAP